MVKSYEIHQYHKTVKCLCIAPGLNELSQINAAHVIFILRASCKAHWHIPVIFHCIAHLPSEKYKMKNYIHKCSRVTLRHTIITYIEILTYRCQRIDHEELSLYDAICLVAQFTSCIAEPSEYFPQRFSNEWPRTAFKDYCLWYVHMIADLFQ